MITPLTHRQPIKTSICPSLSPLRPTARNPAFLNVSSRRVYRSSAASTSSRICCLDKLDVGAWNTITKETFGAMVWAGCGEQGFVSPLSKFEIDQTRAWITLRKNELLFRLAPCVM